MLTETVSFTGSFSGEPKSVAVGAVLVNFPGLMTIFGHTPPSSSVIYTKTNLFTYRFPNQIQAKIRDFFALAVDFESRCLKTFGHGLKQIYKTQFGTIFTRSPTSSSAWKWIFVGHHITLGPCDHMNKAITLVVQRLPQNSENRSHRKIGIQNDNAPFAHDRCHFSCHGGHQCGNTDFGSAFNNRFGFTLEFPEDVYPFMRLGTKGNTKHFFLPIRPRPRLHHDGVRKYTVLCRSCPIPDGAF